jgi:hypothetical protein
MSKKIEYALAAMALILITVVVNLGVSDAAWRADDTQILLHAHRFGWLDDLFNPAVWQQFSPANFTPLLIMSFEADLILFGLSPRLFYLHQLMALAAGSFMLFVCLRLWCGRVTAISAAAVFLCGLPVMLVAEHLMTRHYAEGLVLALLCFYCFVRYLRTGQLWVLIIAALSYLLAALAKEVYVPLPLLLLALPESQWRQRLRAAAPLLAIALLYSVWRAIMLNSLSGGYVDGSSLWTSRYLTDVLAAYATFPRLLLGNYGAILVLIFAALSGRWLYLHRRLPWAGLLAAAVVLLPLAPLVSSPGIVQADRYLFALWAVWIFVIAVLIERAVVGVAAQTIWQRALLTAVLPVIALASLSHALPVRDEVATAGREFDLQGQFVWQNDDSVAFVPSERVAAAFWFVTGMRDFKARIGAGSSPLALVDDIFLTALAIDRLYIWQQDCQCMIDVSATLADRRARLSERGPDTRPLELNFDYRNGFFEWQFGPYTTGSYHVVSDAIGVIEAPPAGRLRVNLPENSAFYLRYSAPEGWVTYSGLQQIVQNGPPVRWVRE